MRTLLYSFIGLFLLSIGFVYADAEDDAIEWLESRQNEIVETYNALDDRVKDLDGSDYRKEKAKELLDIAKSRKNAFNDLDASNHLDQQGSRYVSNETFNKAEKEAREAIAAVTRELVKPVQPGAVSPGEEGTVPEGDLVRDFIPQVIRLLMRFVSLAVLVAFIVSAVMFIAGMGNEERLTKAKQMLYLSLVGFAIVTLAFAIVKAITDIDFFGFI